MKVQGLVLRCWIRAWVIEFRYSLRLMMGVVLNAIYTAVKRQPFFHHEASLQVVKLIDAQRITVQAPVKTPASTRKSPLT